MAKKKKRKETKKKDSKFYIELIGLLLILLSILGFGHFGMVGEISYGFSVFLMGVWNVIFLVGLFITGAYMMVKREKPIFFTSSLVGIYVIFIGILIMSHLSYVEKGHLEGFNIVTKTVDNFLTSVHSLDNIQGGGVIGAIFTAIFVILFDIGGTKIVIWAFIIGGVVMFTGMSIMDMLSKTKEKAASMIKNKSKPKDSVIHTIEDKEEEEKEEKDEKIIVSSVDELIHTGDTVEKNNIEEKEEVPINTVEIED